ncbi:MAG: amidohydrolase family protein [Acidobacteria bacterium]|nr:amidohydrolase family protein [Acidobacteriota bacterium]
MTAALSLVITNVTLIDGTGAPPRSGMTVVFQNGRVAAIGAMRDIEIPASSQRVDGAGKFLIPGLWDMHVHLANQPDSRLTLEIMAPLFVAHGIVGVRDMGSDFAVVQDLRAKIAASTIVGPRIISPGPMIDGPQEPYPAICPVSTESEARQAVRTLAARGVDFIKVQALLSPPAWRAVLDESVAVGLPGMGHVPETVSAADIPASAQRTIEHVSPALPGDAAIFLACSSVEAELRAEMLSIRQAAESATPDIDALRQRQRPLQERMLDTYDPARAEALFRRMRERGTVSVPTLIWSSTFRPGSADDPRPSLPLQFIPQPVRDQWTERWKAFVTAATPEALARHRKFAARSLELVGAMKRAGVTILAGSDSMDAHVLPGVSLHQELELLVKAGLSPLEAIQSATCNGARLLGKLDQWSTLEVGKSADAVLLDADPLADIRNTRRIAAVVVGGALLDRPRLDSILAQVEATAAAWESQQKLQ